LVGGAGTRTAREEGKGAYPLSPTQCYDDDMARKVRHGEKRRVAHASQKTHQSKDVLFTASMLRCNSVVRHVNPSRISESVSSDKCTVSHKTIFICVGPK